MKTQRNTLLAGVAAMALVLGTGLASAQDQSNSQKGAAQPKEPNASTQTLKKGSDHGKMGPSAKSENRGAERKMERNASDQGQGMQKNAKAKSNERVGQSSSTQKGLSQNA